MMNTITLNQSDSNEESLFLYPTSDVRWPNPTDDMYDMYHHHLSSESDNYVGSNCTLVDDKEYNPDDDTTYMYNDGDFGGTDVVESMDLFELPNHTTEVGDIKTVKVVSRARNVYPSGSCDRVTPILEIYGNPRYKIHGDAVEPVTSYYNYSSYSQSYLTLILRPNDDAITANWVADGAATLYECVDEVDPHDEDTTYIYLDLVDSERKCTLRLSDHTTETGTIQQVTVYAVARKTVAGDQADLALTIGNAGRDCRWFEDLTTSYVTYSHTFKKYPNTGQTFTWDNIDSMTIQTTGYLHPGATGEIRVTQLYAVVFYEKAWTWDDVDRMRIGTVSKNENGPKELTSTFRPDGAVRSDHTPVGEANNWECVDEVVPDEDATYVYESGGAGTDMYDIPNHTTESGTINSATLYYRCRKLNNDCTANACSDTEFTPPGASVIGGCFTLNTDWTTYSDTYPFNPWTGLPLTWTDIDGMQPGVYLGCGGATNQAECTQVYLVVNYTKDISQETRITQNYAEVIYYPIRAATIIKPAQITYDHSQQIKMWNHWSGNRTVFSLKRNSKTVTLNGLLHTEPGTGYVPQDELNTLMAMAKNGSTVTFTVSDCIPLNDREYKIRSIGYKTKSTSPPLFEYMIELEDMGMTT